MIISNVSVSDFRDAFRDMGRGDRFSYEALFALYNYLDELSDDCGEPMVLDVIAICCDFAEYDTALEAALEHGFDGPPDLYDIDDDENDRDEVAEELEDEALEWLRYWTTVLECNGSIVIQQF